MRRIVLASGNKGKLKEFSEILNPINFEVVSQGELGVLDIEETGLSFVENAIIKARHACAVTGLPAISDDSGLEVDALCGAPGIYSARFAGEGATDATNIEKLLGELAELDESQRTARFRCVLVCMRHENDPTPLIALGTWEGRVLSAPEGENGFGYDPIFWAPEFDCAAAELTSEQKRSVSHRGKAVAELSAQLADFLR
ncbi:RdgB/HAM1 family non-canonical purine NTP pyrophosphatase [Marinobacterium sp. LSUCC0821]|uniref:RdgB/HAM1 family non-canonical purine NTP pyrophosphatase n=1 Tax=Marinobacterium sp. LSUCC0821 TaxID=2668067 RepID=UPI0014522195|nr:RdgB/HAM1 family non-canonical purine NTP pyrophosphatase [Marinobacterium sp. LSUCC0821]QJD71927.1 RdgB/HAM1 family non-canonical purine NTP pyrophosphatase [Marinobacterium sp. LSUCC0821]